MDTALLSALAERNPDFRVVFRVGFPSTYGGQLSAYPGTSLFVANYLPLTSAKGLVKIERVPPCREPVCEVGFSHIPLLVSYMFSNFRQHGPFRPDPPFAPFSAATDRTEDWISEYQYANNRTLCFGNCGPGQGPAA